jgi:ubiquinone/menaquinone biosynthesis C-methylase UbiE
MGQGIDSDKWSFVLSELIRILKPNGWIEWVEADVEIHRPGPTTLEFNQKLMNFMAENRQDPNIGRTLQKRLEDTNALTQITSKHVSCPGGQWAGKVNY